MALKLIANYSKRLGLPGYSSHQFAITVESEISNLDDVASESARLYQTLQQSVDEEIKQAGFVPAGGYGQTNGNGAHANKSDQRTNGNALWHCTDRQRELILRLTEEKKLDKAEVETWCRDRFDGLSVKQLDSKEASLLIAELFKPVNGRRPQNGAPATSEQGGRR